MLDDPRKRAKFLKSVADTGLIRHSCRVIGLSHAAMCNYRNAHPEFAEQVAEAEEQAIDDLEVAAHAMGKDCDGPMLRFLLACKRPEKYSQRQQVEHTGSVGHEIRIVEDAGWFGNAAHDDLAEGHESPTAGHSVTGQDEAAGVRPTVGQDNDRPAVLPEGPRAEERGEEGSD